MLHLPSSYPLSRTWNKLHCNLPSTLLVWFVNLHQSGNTVWRVGGYYHGIGSSLLRLRKRSRCLESVAFSNLLSLSASNLLCSCLRTLGNDSQALLHMVIINKSWAEVSKSGVLLSFFFVVAVFNANRRKEFINALHMIKACLVGR